MEEVVILGGESSVRRVYGDFTKPQLSAWKDTSLALSFLPINAFSYVSGKGSSDSAMIIDAMELLFTNSSIDGFVLVSSDSDFTRLAQRLREAGKHVVGFGEQKTPAPFVTACERFIHIENLGASSGEAKKLSSSTIDLLNKIIDDASGDDGWLSCSLVGEALIQLKSDFDVRSYGYKKLLTLFQDNREHFELRLDNDGCTYFVRRVA